MLMHRFCCPTIYVVVAKIIIPTILAQNQIITTAHENPELKPSRVSCSGKIRGNSSYPLLLVFCDTILQRTRQEEIIALVDRTNKTARERHVFFLSFCSLFYP